MKKWKVKIIDYQVIMHVVNQMYASDLFVEQK